MMEFLYLLEQIRNPFLDQAVALITYLGSELVFMGLAIVLYWCMSKSRGLYVLSVGYFGTVCNQFLKLTFRIPRPWVRDPGFPIVESARAEATGYSFPSGHTQNAAGTFGALATDMKRRWARALMLLLILLTAFSRMYLGVHTPADVAASLFLAALLVGVLHPVFRNMDEKPQKFYGVLAVMLAAGVAFILYAELWPFPADIDRDNLASGLRNAYKLLGAVVGMAIGYTIDLRYIRFRPQAPLAGQIFKCLLGLLLVLAIKEGLRPIFGSSSLGTAARYGCITLFAAGVWPLTFPYFAKLGRKKA